MNVTGIEAYLKGLLLFIAAYVFVILLMEYYIRRKGGKDA